MGESKKDIQQQEPSKSEAQRKEEWKNKNGPVVIVVIAFGLIVLMCVAMKMCG